MADFRRWITVLAVMALFVGLASAQVGTPTGGYPGSALGTPFQCQVQTTATPNLRSESYTEETGDIVLQCTGGTPLPLGSIIPTTNITVYYNVTAVTSRLLSTSGGINASEAVLLIDEPNGQNPGTQSGYGPNLPQILCSSVSVGAGASGCQQTVGSTTNEGFYTGVPVLGASVANGGSLTGPSYVGTPGPNVYQGIVSGPSVTFEGVPVLPPVSAGVTRIYRITNVRVNANGSAGGVSGGVGQVNASISTNGATTLTISNPNPIVGYIYQSLKTAVANGGSFPQCTSQSGFSGYLQFSEVFATAFKTRVDGFHGLGTNNYSSSPITQNVPSGPINSESNFILNGQGGNATLSGSGYTAGLADYGTRLKAVFSNVPAGVVVYASTVNITSGSGVNGINPAVQPGATTTASSYALLLSSGAEGISDGSGTLPLASYTNSFTGASTGSNASSPVNYVAVTSQGSPIVFVWEVINTQPSLQETIQFATWVSYSAGVPPNTGSSTAQVNLSYAPNPTNGAFSATSGGTATLPSLIPRFADTSTASTFLTINLCSTTLLFPYVTTLTGFTTAISIANTTTDPFKTTAQAGTCTLYWYQGGTAGNPASTTTASIPSGTILPFDTSGSTYAGANFSGYMIAVCNFQLAHGVAIVTDLGSQHILATYLGLVVPTGTNNRNGYSSTSPEALNN